MKNSTTSATAPSSEILTYLQSRLERHFLTCTAAVGAAVVLAPAQQANAEIVHYPVDVQIPQSNLAGIYFNLETGAFGSSAGAVSGWDLNLFNPDAAYLYTYAPATTGLVGYTYGSYRYTDRLGAGTTIGNGSSFLFGGVTTMSANGIYGPWAGTTSGFIGLQFQGSNGTSLFGWMRVEVIDSVSARVTGFAYETSGGSIQAGAIPEPSTLALSFLAFGAAGVGYLRRRRKEAKAV